MIARRVASLLLVACGALGAGMAILSMQGTSVGSMLFMEYGFSHSESVRIERVAAWILLVSAAGLVVRPVRLLCAVVLLIWAVVFSLASMGQGGYPFSDYAFAAHAMRIATPLAVLLVYLPSSATERYRKDVLLWLLIAASATTFMVHGIEAMLAHPWFVDMIIVTAREIPGWTVRQRTAERLLIAVGVIDVLSALALVVLRSRIAACWMAFWGLLTGAIRLTTYGMGAYPEALVRMPQALLPLAILLILEQKHAGKKEPSYMQA